MWSLYWAIETYLTCWIRWFIANSAVLCINANIFNRLCILSQFLNDCQLCGGKKPPCFLCWRSPDFRCPWSKCFVISGKDDWEPMLTSQQKIIGIFLGGMEFEPSACGFIFLLLFLCRLLFVGWTEAKGPRREVEYCPMETTACYLAVFFPGNTNKLEGMDHKVKILSLTSTKHSGETHALIQ